MMVIMVNMIMIMMLMGIMMVATIMMMEVIMMMMVMMVVIMMMMMMMIVSFLQPLLVRGSVLYLGWVNSSPPTVHWYCCAAVVHPDKQMPLCCLSCMLHYLDTYQ